jgi:putative transposase
MGRQVWNLRAPRCAKAVERAMWSGGDRFGFRVVHFAILRDHIHLIVEALDRSALSKGMKGLGVRIARRLNRMMRRQGRVLVDRYHEHILKTPTEVKNARHYLLKNAWKHYGVGGPDELAPAVALYAPHTFMLRMLQ